jgi:hypothetical protein
MYRSLIAACAAIACLALAAPASAQEPAITLTNECDSNNQTRLTVDVTGLPVGEHVGYMIVNTDNVGVGGGTATDFTDENGSHGAILTYTLPRGVYTVYAYTGPYQNLAPAETWEGSIEVDTFEPSLAEVYVSGTFEVTCGPATKDECKFGGWTTSGYKNQGQCVSARVPE